MRRPFARPGYGPPPPPPPSRRTPWCFPHPQQAQQGRRPAAARARAARPRLAGGCPWSASSWDPGGLRSGSCSHGWRTCGSRRRRLRGWRHCLSLSSSRRARWRTACWGSSDAWRGGAEPMVCRRGADGSRFSGSLHRTAPAIRDAGRLRVNTEMKKKGGARSVTAHWGSHQSDQHHQHTCVCAPGRAEPLPAGRKQARAGHAKAAQQLSLEAAAGNLPGPGMRGGRPQKQQQCSTNAYD